MDKLSLDPKELGCRTEFQSTLLAAAGLEPGGESPGLGFGLRE